MADTFWGFGNTQWTAISALASGVYDLLTLALVGFAIIQIVSARREAKINRSLAACDRYDFDPLLDGITRRLALARENGELQSNPQAYRLDLYSILNYLEGVAIGVERGLYHNDVIKDYMEPVFVGCIEEYITTGVLVKCAPTVPVAGGFVEAEDYVKMVKLVERWSRTSLPWHKRVFSWLLNRRSK
jgi:hypothetical protein